MLSNIKLDIVENVTRRQIYYFKSTVLISNINNFEKCFVIGYIDDTLKLNGGKLKFPLLDDDQVYASGILHREDGPAFISDYAKSWRYNNMLHRLDGPAVEYSNGFKEWFVQGNRLSDEKQILLNTWYENRKSK